MEAHEMSPGARDAITAKRVFGKPYEHNGVVVIPVAKIGGGGGGKGKKRYGFGMRGHPVGAFVIRGGKVRWKPVIDMNGMLLRAQVMAGAAALLMLMRR
jgi:uncharacterized spore protein YtfJ